MIIRLTEHTPLRLAAADLPAAVAELLWRHYPHQVAVDFPSPKTNNQWQLTGQGWVGAIPLTPDFRLELQPKVALTNLWQMLEYAYDLDLRLPPGLTTVSSLADFYDRLAGLLAGGVSQRFRNGLHRVYVQQTEQLPYVRGQVDLRQILKRPWQVKLESHFEEHSVDNPDNQILAWTLATILRSGLGRERTLPAVRRAYRALQGVVTLQPYPPQACANRVYSRLNQDYRPLHAICRFFLAHVAPGHTSGDQTMRPFLVDMAQLFERFVAQWLQPHLPANRRLHTQERVNLDDAGNFHFRIDMVLTDAGSGRPLAVIDTKYKSKPAPDSDDIAQIIAYAQAKQCRHALLIYPTALAYPLDTVVGQIHVQTLPFDLALPLEQAAQPLLSLLYEAPVDH
jgi:5-methylcytosine-specific restriction enzyme subunit McrC